MFLILKINSKNKFSYKNFLKFLVTEINGLNEFPVYINKLKKQKLNKKKFTVLKSPHVNKTAQEQFEIRNYTSYLEIYSYSNVFLIFLIKQISKKLCKDIKIEIKISFDNLKVLSILKKNLNPNSTFLNKLDNRNIKGYLKFLDCYGEICFFKSLDSSVG